MKKLRSLPARGGGRPTQRDLSAFMDGSAWEATRGKDFDCQVSSYIRQLYAAAKANNKRVQVRRILPKTVAFQFSDK